MSAHAPSARRGGKAGAGVASAASVVAALLAGTLGCPDAAPAEAARCQRASRLAGERARVRQLWPTDEAPVVVDVAAPCGGARCLRTTTDRIAVFQPDGRVWLSTGTRRDGQVQPANDPSVPPGPPMTSMPPAPPPPTLPPELRTCGQTFAGGGVGWHIIRNRGDVWQRVEWVVPPTLAEVRSLPVDAYPLPRADGALCGFGRQRAERQWVIHHLSSGQSVDAIADREHAPARCVGDDGALAVEVADGTVVLSPDGARRLASPSSATPPPPGLPDIVVTDVAGAVVVHQPRGELQVRRADGTQLVLPLRDDVDIDQTPLPAGTSRDRVATAGDGDRSLLVAERLTLPGCAVRERLFLVDVVSGRGQRITDDDVVLVRLSFAAGRFVWVEAEPEYVDTSGGS
jgi:hypothetical protein